MISDRFIYTYIKCRVTVSAEIKAGIFRFFVHSAVWFAVAIQNNCKRSFYGLLRKNVTLATCNKNSLVASGCVTVVIVFPENGVGADISINTCSIMCVRSNSTRPLYHFIFSESVTTDKLWERRRASARYLTPQTGNGSQQEKDLVRSSFC